ncbi:DUF2235 domain-containing protein [Cronobacter sakazakii]|uniref:phospholipase effector Tle1 domain-containing protein n=1 Tax=Cronobacter sakazakii TaxID=28141 RepID=UPI000CFD0962|nr:DUF2235 domain-containing protein [Cronobacter sakazakii]
MDMDAIIATASRANQSIQYNLGSCSRVLHIGFFFDGVGHNVEQDAPNERLSNIARLFRAFPDDKDNTDYAFIHYKKHYIPGLGTPFNDDPAEFLQSQMDKARDDYQGGLPTDPKDAAEDFAKDALSGKSPKETLTEMRNKLLSPVGRLDSLKQSYMGNLKKIVTEATPWLRDSRIMAYIFATGVDSRLESAKSRFASSFKEAVSTGEIPVKLISVSLFGYDLGATLARQFIDILLTEICKKNGDQYTYESVPVDIVFTGLFDCSRDTPASSNNGMEYADTAAALILGGIAKVAATICSMLGRKYIDHMSPLPEQVKKSLHLVAAHERRPWRCIYRTGQNDRHCEELMPGCSEDIGGGLKPDEQKPCAELSRVALNRMYREAMKAGVPFPDLSSLYQTDAMVWSYFLMRDTVNGLTASEWTARYQRAVPPKCVTYQALNRHLDSYFEWLGAQYYLYRKRLRLLEAQHSAIYRSYEAANGLLGISSQAKSAADDIVEDIAILKKHWGWLDEVRDAAYQQLRDDQDLPPVYYENVYEPACIRAQYFIDCGGFGYRGEPAPPKWDRAPSEIYSWFVHDVQTLRNGDSITNEFFCIRWMEPH